MSKIKNSMDFEFVNSWAGAVSPGKIMLAGWDKDNQPVWAEVLSNKATGQALCERILTIRYRFLDNGVVAEDEFYEGEAVTVRRKV